ncbi:MAG: DNA repair protein RecN [Pseudomonadota bacterium]
MLSDISIRDFTIIDRLDLSLLPGMTVLTGETGAGKSIIIDAVGIALGERADTGTVRVGCARAEIQLSFALAQNAPARAWLAAQELDTDGECIVRRTINREGGTRAYINGRAVPIQQLRELGDLLLDIHGQHQHQSLLKKDVQRELLDRFGGHGALAAQVAVLAQRWRHTKQRLDELSAQRATREERMGYLRYQVQELDNLKLGPHEWPQWEADYHRLSNIDALTATIADAISQLDDADDAITTKLNRLLQALSGLVQAEKRLSNPAEMLTSALIQLNEASSELRDIGDHLELDPQRLSQLEQRMRAAHDLARKHRVTESALPALHARYLQELAHLDNSDQDIEQLMQTLNSSEADYLRVAQDLSKRRHKVALSLAEGVTTSMRELGMPGGQFKINLARDDATSYAAHGLERVEFCVATNPGQPLKPLVKVVSGGELSRISLAIQVITAQIDGIPTLIFDEVDVGIGGGVAEVVGEKLRALGARRQVLCVTHLPQVAAQGHQHWRVQKEAHDDTTLTRISPLSETERVGEISRMLGGVEITAKTRAHAQEMLVRAQNARAAAETVE